MGRYIGIIAAIGYIGMLGWVSAGATQGPSGAFSKAAPANGATGLPFPGTVTLSWAASTAAVGYSYCYDTTNDNSCTSWTFVDTDLSATINNLAAGTTYYWQVRVYSNVFGFTYANGGAFWAFTTDGNPGPFNKVLPNSQFGVSLKPTLAWSSSAGAVGYEYCYDTVNDGTCATWIATSKQTASLSGLSPNTVYYWQVRVPSVYGGTYADGSSSAFWSFTTMAPPACNVLSLNGTALAAAETSVLPISGSPGSFTVEAWIAPSQSSGGTTRFRSIVADDGYSLFLDEEFAGVLGVGVALHPSSTWDFMFGSGLFDGRAVTLNEWHHVAFVYDHTTQQIRFGIDGVLGRTISVPSIDFAASGRHLTVGRFVGSLDDSAQFSGLIDGVRISSVARYATGTYTPSETLVNDANTRALYEFGETTGTTVFADTSGNGHTLTGAGGAKASFGGNCVERTPRTLTGDFDGDGSADLLLTHSDGRTALWLMSGTAVRDGAFLIGPHSGWRAKLTGDLDGDGKTDILWEHVDGSTAVWLMDGLRSTNGAVLIGPGSGWTAVRLADLNGDGARDIVWGRPDGAAAIWLMSGVSSITGAMLIDPGSGWSLRDIGDFNGDGRQDLVWQHIDGRTAVWLMNGVTPVTTGIIIGAGTEWRVVGSGDFNGDGKSDLVLQHVDGRAAIWLMDGVNIANSKILLGAGSGWMVDALGDLDGDYRADLILRHGDGSAAAWLIQGVDIVNGAFLFGPGTGWTVLSAQDGNGDGKTDLLLQHTDGRTAIWLMNGLVVTNGAFLLDAESGWLPASW